MSTSKQQTKQVLTKIGEKSSLSPRERILQVATELFYHQGFRATGINEVIEKSGVAKATFYHHFPSKDELASAYLDALVDIELADFDATVTATKGVKKRLFVPLQWLRSWLDETQFRGCAFLHMVAEIPDAKHPLRRPGKRFYDASRQRVGDLVGAFLAADVKTKKYPHLKAEALTEAYMLLLAGAIALAQIYQQAWPVEQAMKTLQKMLDKPPA